MRRNQPSLARPEFMYIPFIGGYDTESRPWSAPPGLLRESENYEIGVNGQGYVDIEGYEAFDGQPSPSDAAYYLLYVDITGAFSDGDVITQLVSGATGTVISVVTSVTPNYLVLTKVTGTFNDTNALQVSSVTQGTSQSLAIRSGASTKKLHAQYTNLASDEYRADITEVPGENKIRGIDMLNDVWYAFRDASGGATLDIYKSTVSGWSKVDLGFELEFTSGGVYVIEEGDVITGGTSGATATVTRVVVESGSWEAGDAAGRVIFASQTGTFQSEVLDVGANSNVATIAGDSSAITLLPGGRFEFVHANFGGQAGSKRLYGCDGVNRAFEFDGSVFVPINTTVDIDKPTHIEFHKNHLFLSFSSSAQHSAIGDPYRWAPIFGAGELATGDTITAFRSEPGSEGNGVLGIYNRNTIHILYGSSEQDWNLVKYREEIGAYSYTLQQFGQTMFFDDRGITTLGTSQSFGNFQAGTVSQNIQRFINSKRSVVLSSCISRNKNQYRIFFSDNYGLYATVEGNRILGFMPVKFLDTVECVSSRELSDGTEEIMFGSSDGKVYQLDKGTSFDGSSIDAYMKFFFYSGSATRFTKRYLGITLEAEGSGYAEFSLSTELGYNSTDVSQPSPQSQVMELSEVVWDNFIWDQFIWDGVNLSPADLKLSGTAENISLVIRKSSDYYQTLNITGALIRFAYRRQLR